MGYLAINSSIFGTSSGIRKGLLTTSSRKHTSKISIKAPAGGVTYARLRIERGNASSVVSVKGHVQDLPMPAFNAVWTCSALAFAVTAMIGTWPVNLPSCSSSRIFLVQVKPSMTGIS